MALTLRAQGLGEKRHKRGQEGLKLQSLGLRAEAEGPRVQFKTARFGLQVGRGFRVSG